MRSLKTWLIEREEDKELGSNERLKRIALGYNDLEEAKRSVEAMNQECSSCARKRMLHTKFRLIEPPIRVRVIKSEVTPEEYR